MNHRYLGECVNNKACAALLNRSNVTTVDIKLRIVSYDCCVNTAVLLRRPVKPTLDIDIVHVLHIVFLALVYNKMTAQKSSAIGMLLNRVQTGENFL
jgi:hypothetical protein